MISKCIFDLVRFQLEDAPQEVCLAEWTPEGVSSWTTAELQSRIDRYILVFASWGLRPGEIIVICSKYSTRVELAIEMAALRLGAIVCPLSTYLTENDLSAILRDLGTSRVLCQLPESKASFERMPEISESKTKCVVFDDLEKEGGPDRNPMLPDIDPGRCAFVIYTSGSDGRPKGVMLSHRNILSNVEGLMACMPIRKRHRVVSYLSRSHIMERTATYTYLAGGASIFFVPSPNMLQAAILEIQPKWMTAVPLILERIYAAIFHQVENGKWYQRTLFSGSKRSGIIRLLARIFIINAWKRNYGRGLKGVIVGGAALSAEIARLFNASGIRIREGYGLTETSPAITFNRYRRKDNRFGTAGIPLNDVSVRIREADPETGVGEIEVKGPNVMLGYYRNEEATRQRVREDGWLRTGDIGRWVDGRFLQITDRLSNIYKNASGRFVSPGPIEQKLIMHPSVDQAVVYGLNKPFNLALIIPDFQWLRSWARSNGVHWTDNVYMVHNPRVKTLFDQVLKELNKGLKHHERLSRHVLGSEKWTRENGMLTLTMKPRRKQIIKAFGKRIEEIYETPSP